MKKLRPETLVPTQGRLFGECQAPHAPLALCLHPAPPPCCGDPLRPRASFSGTKGLETLQRGGAHPSSPPRSLRNFFPACSWVPGEQESTVPGLSFAGSFLSEVTGPGGAQGASCPSKVGHVPRETQEGSDGSYSAETLAAKPRVLNASFQPEEKRIAGRSLV